MRTRLRLTLACCSFFLTTPCFACTCRMSSPSEAKITTERESVAQQVNSEGLKRIIFEGIAEKQELVPGSPGVPEGTMSMTTWGQHRIVTIRVLRMYRGPNGERFTLLTGLGTGDCGFDFETGKEYLVFADTAGDGTLFTSICAPTEPLEAAAPALLRFLRNEPAAPEDSLDPETYYKRYVPDLSGSVCGKVEGADGKPLAEASVEVWQVRDDPFPPFRADAENGSQPDGTYCIEGVRPGSYILTAEKEDFDAENRLMGYYPSVYKHSEAARVEVTSGSTMTLPAFKVQKENLYKIRILVVTPEGGPPPPGGMRVAIRATEEDGLSYQEDGDLGDDGDRTFGFIPAGTYIVTCEFLPDMDAEQYAKNVAKWLPFGEGTIEVKGNTGIILRLTPRR